LKLEEEGNGPQERLQGNGKKWQRGEITEQDEKV